MKAKLAEALAESRKEHEKELLKVQHEFELKEEAMKQEVAEWKEQHHVEKEKVVVRDSKIVELEAQLEQMRI